MAFATYNHEHGRVPVKARVAFGGTDAVAVNPDEVVYLRRRDAAAAVKAGTVEHAGLRKACDDLAAAGADRIGGNLSEEARDAARDAGLATER